MKIYFPKKVVYSILSNFILLGCPNAEDRKAEKLGVKIIDENEFEKMIK